MRGPPTRPTTAPTWAWLWSAHARAAETAVDGNCTNVVEARLLGSKGARLPMPPNNAQAGWNVSAAGIGECRPPTAGSSTSRGRAGGGTSPGRDRDGPFLSDRASCRQSKALRAFPANPDTGLPSRLATAPRLPILRFFRRTIAGSVESVSERSVEGVRKAANSECRRPVPVIVGSERDSSHALAAALKRLHPRVRGSMARERS